jgi:hypothetical protein
MVPKTKKWFSTDLGYPSKPRILRGVVFGTVSTFIVKATVSSHKPRHRYYDDNYDTGGIKIS